MLDIALMDAYDGVQGKKSLAKMNMTVPTGSVVIGVIPSSLNLSTEDE